MFDFYFTCEGKSPHKESMSSFPKHTTKMIALKCVIIYMIFDWVNACGMNMMHINPCSHSSCEYYLIVVLWSFAIGSFPHVLMMFMFGGSFCLFVHILGYHKDELIWSIFIDDAERFHV
ncbi:hypothetical protein KP509_16G083600 [Ceratopteris richardii]|nr:hypothetical protein KP509_16G083600 [Ceratopteris richardii]